MHVSRQLGLLFTGILAAFSWLLWDVSKETKEISIGIGGDVLRYFQGQKVTEVEVSVLLENSGTTPTKSVVAQSNCESRPNALPKGFNYGDIPGSENQSFIIAPKTTISIFVPRRVSIDQLNNIKRNKSYLFVWGSIIYRDIFPNTPTGLTEFCYEVIDVSSSNQDLSNPTTGITLRWTPCKEHNCYDEQCPDYREKIK